VHALCVAAAGIAFAAVQEPVSGGLLSIPGDVTPALIAAAPPVAPAPAPTPAPAAAGKGDDTSWGLLVRGGYFGLPDFIADELFVQHPDIAGTSIGLEFRYHGDDGGRGVSSIGLAVDYATAKADGVWQENESDEITHASGEVTMLAFTVTGYWSLFPSWYVHPYVGFGLGAGYFKGTVRQEEDLTEVAMLLPVLHVPVGLAAEFGKSAQLALEARFLDGISLGGSLQVRF
jgi:opacity protein-like surface antigen